MRRTPAQEIRLTAQVAAAGCAAKLGPGDLRLALGQLRLPRRDPRVLVDASTLDDAGLYAHGRGEALVQTVDFFTPIVDDPYDFGQIAAANALSDVFAMGGKPLTSLALLCSPDGTLPTDVIAAILQGGLDKMHEAGASVVGGHSIRDPELKFGYAVTGIAKRRRLLLNSGARPGDVLFLTKPLGTGVLTTALKQGKLEPGLLRRVTKQMATLNRAASEAAVEHGASAATDITGFSLLGHASQVADASNVTLALEPRADWLLPRVRDFLGQDVYPGGLARNRKFFAERVDEDGVAGDLVQALYDPQTSGGLLIAVAGRRAAALESALRRRRVWHVRAGEVARRGARSVRLSAGS
ncbi:MAG TPA: selenide, water dikinase SelD [Candidatus Acidoferrales bacterium]|nr:selenide, water dikinase SelD [Candidatus Acidoferrales bacterium]